MRKWKKTQVEKMISLLGQAHKEIKRALEKKESDIVLELTEQCQEAAIETGGIIEAEEGGNAAAVHLLEEYCEQLYQLYEMIRQYRLANWGGACKALQKKLTQIKNSVRNDIPVRTEAVFLPYKASMWDSLESVWKSACEDADCDAYVVPIPYYDRNPDGSFGKLHYEGDLYPEDVPVVPYDAYDFEGRHPDMIFIHNPYDDGNYVTSVHPFFYSKNLKQYTDDLIYIPYFVLREIDPSDHAAVSGMKHFCTAAGVWNADHVIVQSEAMRQIYVDVLTRYTGEEQRSCWQKKILGLGSPKVDRVNRLTERDFQLPEEWKRRIQREDGSKKKIIFYNTSVSALLQHGEAMLAKIERSLRIFEKNRENVTLLWRPHPLSEVTLASMRPQMKERYDRMIREYRAAGWGIYDDTPDLERAIAVSDAYYGDHSSVVWLYQQTGKPIMIQTVNV
ncbi:MAG: CDP-glycerol glycerophosphotransferase family protein [Lachnospiraceae bacterium]